MHTTPARRRIAGATLALGAVFLGMSVFAPAASADHVDPTPITGDANLTCTEVEPGFTEHKINAQPANDSTHTFGDVEIFISGVTTVDGKLQFDWSATTVDGDDAGDARDAFFYDAVIVKAGGLGTESSGNLYSYDPEVSSDTDLESPKDSISHISFCFDGETGGTDDGGDTTTGDVQATTGEQEPETEVLGNVVEPQQLPATGDNDRSLAIIGVALILIGGGTMLIRRDMLNRS